MIAHLFSPAQTDKDMVSKKIPLKDLFSICAGLVLQYYDMNSAQFNKITQALFYAKTRSPVLNLNEIYTVNDASGKFNHDRVNKNKKMAM